MASLAEVAPGTFVPALRAIFGEEDIQLLISSGKAPQPTASSADAAAGNAPCAHLRLFGKNGPTR